MLWRSIEAKSTSEGFTLVEVLVALAIVAVALGSIGALIANTSRGARSIAARFSRVEIARAILTALPDRDQLGRGNLSGETAGHGWQVDVSPFEPRSGGLSKQTSWLPQRVDVTVRSPIGDVMQISTVRLQRKNGE